MPVVDNQALKSFDLPGLNHRTFAGPEHGLKNLEVWGQVIAPGSGTPVHRHACEEAIVVLKGSGTLTVSGVVCATAASSVARLIAGAVKRRPRSMGRATLILSVPALPLRSSVSPSSESAPL